MNRIALAAAVSLLPFTALATPPEGVLWNIELNHASTAGPVCDSGSFGDWELRLQTSGASDFIIQDIAFDAGGHSGWHSHPGPVLITVKNGTATFYQASDPDCTPQVYEAGSAFIEPMNAIHAVQNESDVDELRLFDAFIIPMGVDRRIDQDQPVNCPQVP
jgi:quercetin dioxygenase-like cupin family protein